MKRIIKKLQRNKQADSPARITNDTVAEHRERVLAGGRKFKYPIQYSKHRLVINSIIIGVVAIVVAITLLYFQLYIRNDTSSFTYRVTQLIPLPVARVDGTFVRYSEYLMRYRSSQHYLQQQDNVVLGSADGKRQLETIRRKELDAVEFDAYVRKVAQEKNIMVTDEEVDATIQATVKDEGVSLEAFEKTVLNNFYDWTMGEYRSVVKSALLRKKVAAAIDTVARDKINQADARLRAGQDFFELAKQVSEDQYTKANGGVVGQVPINNQDATGVLGALKTLDINQTTGIITAGDGYYIAKLIAKDDKNVNYAQIKIPFTKLSGDYNSKKATIKEYITIKE